ncbi:uncharacterized protein B0I36DRAFT_268838 [Microdochium trichocladiopsis]|uniref:Aminoglycoside phosphotransferase domain-containing protein n=1 Tax=Microdochium trichocladiopsis TaxID=1682393 RepID=A0A9P8XQC5_9PEZI|nr:uncharacterized protein B0I36DRAFT_257165 [Microdochium trichocladiopsis]XP_046011029.1 uncharacterized protein B0I36DRAFT_268838 [Microdochium trichocladiopsis]KAH7010899.1 hypothetical protein B0I36DRAFT_257165 [Microdochium trichocladiopsis]KAH7028741.1 hypothetical protein B0I36DRAFT_268838 [Microdochium trichocladiopsis]
MDSKKILWEYFHHLPDGPLRTRACTFLESIRWDELIAFAAAHGQTGSFLPLVGLGHNHMVRIIEAPDGARWLARLELPHVLGRQYCDDILVNKRNAEVNVVRLLQDRTDIPVPHIYALDLSPDNVVGAPFVIFECLSGNSGMDIQMTIPRQHIAKVIRDLARIHVQLSQVRLPKIGSIMRLHADGTVELGPIAGVGGPFDTASQFFKAWAAATQFPRSAEDIQRASGDYAKRILDSVSTFPQSISEISGISVRDSGPFPLWNRDWGWNNTIFDDDLNLLGAIDWEFTISAPWELSAQFPHGISTVPSSIDAPSNYNDDGSPKDAELRQTLEDQKAYLRAIREAEIHIGTDQLLSQALCDRNRHDVARAMGLFEDGKLGLYSEVIKQYGSS